MKLEYAVSTPLIKLLYLFLYLKQNKLVLRTTITTTKINAKTKNANAIRYIIAFGLSCKHGLGMLVKNQYTAPLMTVPILNNVFL